MIQGRNKQMDHLIISDQRRIWIPATPEDSQMRCRTFKKDKEVAFNILGTKTASCSLFRLNLFPQCTTLLKQNILTQFSVHITLYDPFVQSHVTVELLFLPDRATQRRVMFNQIFRPFALGTVWHRLLSCKSRHLISISVSKLGLNLSRSFLKQIGVAIESQKFR